MKSKTPIDPAERVTNGLRDREFQPALHLSRAHPTMLNEQCQGGLDIAARTLSHKMRALGIKFTNQAEHYQQVGLRDTFLAQRDYLPLPQTDRQRFWS